MKCLFLAFQKNVLRNSRKNPVKNVEENQLENNFKKKFEGKSLTEKNLFHLIANDIFLIEKNT